MHWQADQMRRRRSANADILESYGLPSTGSYNDMKSLQDGPRRSDLSGGCLRAAMTAATTTARALSTSALRWSQKITAAPAACRQRHTRKKALSKKNACWLCESETGSLHEHEKDDSLQYTDNYPDTNRTIRAVSPVQAVSPGQWLKQRGEHMACDLPQVF